MTDSSRQQDQSAGLWVLASARSKDEADQGAFSEALRAVLADRKHGGLHQPYLLNFEDLHTSIDDQFRARGLGQRAVGSALALRGRFLFFRNPRYRAGLPTDSTWRSSAGSTRSRTGARRAGASRSTRSRARTSPAAPPCCGT